MRRREVVAGLAVATMWPLGAGPNRPGRPWLVCSAAPASMTARLRPFVKGSSKRLPRDKERHYRISLGRGAL
jgi:hypothetical protein